MKIAVYGIALNEAKFAERFMAGAREADGVFIADTGSTDGTAEAFRAAGATVSPISIDPWRFDRARNAALELVPPDFDICVSLDMDEVIAPGWRAALEAAWTPGTTAAAYRFIVDRMTDGAPGTEFRNTRIHARQGYEWRHPCHEAIYAVGIAEQIAPALDITVEHLPDPAKSRAQYSGLLATAVRQAPDDARMAFYHARQLHGLGRHAEAVAEFDRYLAMRPTPPVERTMALVLAARSHEALGEAEAALGLRREATKEGPGLREGWVDLARQHYRMEAWADCHSAATRALAIERRPGVFVFDARAWGAAPHDLASISAWHLGRLAEALAHAEQAVRCEPADPRLQLNLAFIREKMAEKQG